MKHLCSDEPRLTAVSPVPRVSYTPRPHLTHQMPGTSFPLHTGVQYETSPPNTHLVSKLLHFCPGEALESALSAARAILWPGFPIPSLAVQVWDMSPFGLVPSKRLVKEGERYLQHQHPKRSSELRQERTGDDPGPCRLSADPEGAAQQRKKHLGTAWKRELVKSSVQSTPRLLKTKELPPKRAKQLPTTTTTTGHE